MDDIDLDIKLRELEESVKCRRERRKEQKKVMEQELEHNLKSLKKESQSQDRSVVNESEKQLGPLTAGSGNNSGNTCGNVANNGNLVSDQEEKYIRELCETEKRIRQLESVISDLNFELEKIDLAETTGSVGVTVKTGAENSRVSTDI